MVVITYSSVDRVLRQVDHISPMASTLTLPTGSDPSAAVSGTDASHKCRLLDAEIPAITYNSGGTYTLGALQQAIEVLKV